MRLARGVMAQLPVQAVVVVAVHLVTWLFLPDKFIPSQSRQVWQRLLEAAQHISQLIPALVLLEQLVVLVVLQVKMQVSQMAVRIQAVLAAQEQMLLEAALQHLHWVMVMLVGWAAVPLEEADGVVLVQVQLLVLVAVAVLAVLAVKVEAVLGARHIAVAETTYLQELAERAELYLMPFRILC